MLRILIKETLKSIQAERREGFVYGCANNRTNKIKSNTAKTYPNFSQL
jgi:hypothetical protein